MQLKGGIQSYLTHNKATGAPSASTTATNMDAATGLQRDDRASVESWAAPSAPTSSASSSWQGHCFVFDERTAVDAAGESITEAEAERLALQLGPRAGRSLRKRLGQVQHHNMATAKVGDEHHLAG